MEWYWRLKDIPELRGMDAPARRRRWSEALRHYRTRRQALLLVATYTGLYAAASAISAHWHWRWFEHMAVGCTVIGLAALVFEMWVQQPRARKWVRDNAGNDANTLRVPGK
jgi:hypothetical protein